MPPTQRLATHMLRHAMETARDKAAVDNPDIEKDIRNFQIGLCSPSSRQNTCQRFFAEQSQFCGTGKTRK